VTIRDGDLDFTLAELATGLRAGDLPRPVDPGAWTRAAFRVTRNSRPAREWEPVDVMLSDATGNRWSPPDTFVEPKGDEKRFFFGGTLCPDEPAWKLRVRFARVSGFAPEELWTVRDLAVPEPGFGESAPVTAAAQRQGVTLRVQRVSRWARPPLSDLPAEWPYRCALEISAPVPDDLRLTVLRATDERGRRLIARFRHDGRGRCTVSLSGPPPLQKVNVTFAIQRCCFVEFVAAPSGK
jgi:hypothetical protein